MKRISTLLLLVVFGVAVGVIAVWAAFSIKTAEFSAAALAVGAAFWLIIIPRIRDERKRHNDNWRSMVEAFQAAAPREAEEYQASLKRAQELRSLIPKDARHEIRDGAKGQLPGLRQFVE